jgi:hypothetical protein
MGVPTSEVGYTAAMPRREVHEVHKDMWWGIGPKNKLYADLWHCLTSPSVLLEGATPFATPVLTY